jgi:wyosine [tRNA(Phe)-imidazoG37] synthetase (radical SAM superfamily)
MALGRLKMLMKSKPMKPMKGSRRVRAIRVAGRTAGRDYQGRSWVYFLLSAQTRGLSLGINLSPSGACDYRCCYCDIPKVSALHRAPVDVQGLALELEAALDFVASGQVVHEPTYSRFPTEWLSLRQVMLSGEGEPTLCPNFVEVMETLVHARALGRYPFFKLVLETNGSGLQRPEVQQALELFTSQDEVWVKLDAGTDSQFHGMSGVDTPFHEVLARILDLGRRRPIVIQSLFASVDGFPPARGEIQNYVRCLGLLQEQGAMIQRVHIQSVTNGVEASRCTHLPLAILSEIACQVRRELGVEVEVF